MKNYVGDYYDEKERIYYINNKEIMNPSYQIIRSAGLLRQFLQNIDLSIPPITSKIVFINPSFMLYNAPIEGPVIFPNQIEKKLPLLIYSNKVVGSQHKLIAEKLLAAHKEYSPYSKIPNYIYEQLRMGLICKECRSFQLELEERNLLCRKCGKRECLEHAIIRMVEEFKVLFPNEKVTTSVISDWIQHIVSYKVIKRILKKHYTFVECNRWSYYK